MDEVRVMPSLMQKEFHRILLSRGFSGDKATTCAQLFTENSVDGAYTHGVNRFAKFIDHVDNGYVKKDNEAVCSQSSGAVETWNGQLGPGPVNALICTDRAMRLSDQFTIGCVALAHTNHWMRAGAYGWKAAKDGYAFIGWTNTVANMPAWGASDARLGNNPLVIAIPFEGEAIVLDMAMSQYSYGAMELAKLRGEKLSVAGGFDQKGGPTNDPAKILASRKSMPAGFWKGSALSLLLDLMAVVLSNGASTAEITRLPEESDCSQVFIAINLGKMPHHSRIPELIRNIIDDYAGSVPSNRSKSIRYPGEKALALRKENSTRGIPVAEAVWNRILKL